MLGFSGLGLVGARTLIGWQGPSHVRRSGSGADWLGCVQRSESEVEVMGPHSDETDQAAPRPPSCPASCSCYLGVPLSLFLPLLLPLLLLLVCSTSSAISGLK